MNTNTKNKITSSDAMPVSQPANTNANAVDPVEKRIQEILKLAYIHDRFRKHSFKKTGINGDPDSDFGLKETISYDNAICSGCRMPVQIDCDVKNIEKKAEITLANLYEFAAEPDGWLYPDETYAAVVRMSMDIMRSKRRLENYEGLPLVDERFLRMQKYIDTSLYRDMMLKEFRLQGWTDVRKLCLYATHIEKAMPKDFMDAIKDKIDGKQPTVFGKDDANCVAATYITLGLEIPAEIRTKVVNKAPNLALKQHHAKAKGKFLLSAIRGKSESEAIMSIIYTKGANPDYLNTGDFYKRINLNEHSLAAFALYMLTGKYTDHICCNDLRAVYKFMGDKMPDAAAAAEGLEEMKKEDEHKYIFGTLQEQIAASNNVDCDTALLKVCPDLDTYVNFKLKEVGLKGGLNANTDIAQVVAGIVAPESNPNVEEDEDNG